MWDWGKFLKQLSLERIAAQEERGDLPLAMVESQWLGHPGASAEEIQVTESRLGVRLPNSYREFLKVSNGWGDREGDCPDFHLLPVEDIDWLVSSEPRLVAALNEWEEEDFVYLRTCLKISNTYGDRTIALLNPEFSWVEGEWETWGLDSKLGAYRYQTFWDFMQHEPPEY